MKLTLITLVALVVGVMALACTATPSKPAPSTAGNRSAGGDGNSESNASPQQSASSIHRQQQEKQAQQSEPAPSAGLLAAPNIYNHYSREAPDNETIQFKGFPRWAESGREGSETIILQIDAVSNGHLMCVFPDTVENTIQMARFSTTMPRPFVTFEGVVSEWVGSDLWIDSCRVLAIEKR